MPLKVLIAGLGRSGMGLASQLCDVYKVIGVDLDRPVCDCVSSGVCDPDRLTVINADATSAFALKKNGAHGAQVAVACLGSDEANLAAIRIFMELGIQQRYALMYDPRSADAYRDLETESVDRSGAVASLLASRIKSGQTRVTSCGRGAGEILEVEVLPGSSVVGMALLDLRPRRWIVAAIYRQGELIVPHGETVI